LDGTGNGKRVFLGHRAASDYQKLEENAPRYSEEPIVAAMQQGTAKEDEGQCPHDVDQEGNGLRRLEEKPHTV